MDNSVNTVMSRSGSLPLKVAYELLKEYGSSSAIVLDPFCGKGTTLLAARMLGISAFGLDVAPEAVICTKSKLVDVSLDAVSAYIESLQMKSASLAYAPEWTSIFYHPATLKQIMSIRTLLLKDVQSTNRETKSNAVFTLACMLGILHGHASYSLSVSSAHAFSMAPSYVARYAHSHGLKRPIRDVKACLLTKVSKCLSDDLPKPVNSGVKRASVLTCPSSFPELIGKVDTIITSPPYLNAQTYAKDNWLRLWFLGYDYKVIHQDYIETQSISKYGAFMWEAFGKLVEMLKPGGRLVCIAGDVYRKPHRKNVENVSTIFETGTYLGELCQSGGIGLRVELNNSHSVASSSRYYHALNQSNGHSKRDLVERVLVAIKE